MSRLVVAVVEAAAASPTCSAVQAGTAAVAGMAVAAVMTTAAVAATNGAAGVPSAGASQTVHRMADATGSSPEFNLIPCMLSEWRRCAASKCDGGGSCGGGRCLRRLHAGVGMPTVGIRRGE
ncbi:unnamed protein product [Phaeothamnion confervicola]